MQPLKFGAGIWMFQQFIDRYATDGYGPVVSTLDAIALASKVDGLEALDITYPFLEANLTIEEVRDALARHNLRASSITPVIYGREFSKGSFTNPDPMTRSKAIDLVKSAVDVARKLGANYVKLWPGQDGFDYPFQVNYDRIWELALSGVAQVADYDPSMMFAIEYKPKEPRTHLLFSTASQTILAIQQIGRNNIGIVLDLGHSLYAGETPADALRLVLKYSKLLGVDFNDNWRSWDDDLTVASVHLIETIEFIYALRKSGWEGVWQLDQFPFREDPVSAARASIYTIRSINSLLDELDEGSLAELQEAQDALKAQRLLQDLLFSRKSASS